MAEIASYPQNMLDGAVWKELLWQQANVLYHQKDFASARRKLMEWQNADASSGYTMISLSVKYALLSRVFEAQKQYDSALFYNKRHLETEEEIAANENLAQSMIILSDRNHALTRLELTKTKKYNRTLLISLAVAAMLLFSIIMLAYRLHRSKVALVKQYLAKENKYKVVKGLENQVSTAVDEPVNGNDAREKELIIQLEKLMQGKSAFLNPKIGLGDVAEALATNRTYLSQAINNQLNTSFPNYINELRINEAVKLITSGYVASHTQEAMARECGFTSRSAFTAAFKRVTGVVPSFFIANHGKS
jgi:AraC-like DNA-binding protein